MYLILVAQFIDCISSKRILRMSLVSVYYSFVFCLRCALKQMCFICAMFGRMLPNKKRSWYKLSHASAHKHFIQNHFWRETRNKKWREKMQTVVYYIQLNSVDIAIERFSYSIFFLSSSSFYSLSPNKWK